MSIEDIIMKEEMFEEKPLDFPFGETEKRLADLGISMPSFRTFEPKDPVATIMWDKESEEFYSDKIAERYADPTDIYDILRGAGFDPDFDDSVLQSGLIEKDVLGYSVETKNRNFGRSLFGNIDTRGLDYTHYYQWLQTARSWINNRSDFMLSYSFVNGHPALWTRSRPDRSPHDWNTSSGVSRLWSQPTWRSNGSVVMMMEAGAAVPPHRQYTYHDTRLDTYEDTYEKGIITTANRIHKFFDLDGSDRPDVGYEKSDPEVELEECMAAIAKGHSGSKLDNDE